MTRIRMFLPVAVLLLILALSGYAQATVDPYTCDWVLKTITGSDKDADTNSTIGIYILNPFPIPGHFAVADLNAAYRKPPGVPRPFRRSQVDYFGFKGPCYPVCRITFENTQTGIAPAWQLASAEADITIPGLPVRKMRADNINGWVAANRAPFNKKLTVNFCNGEVTTGATKPTKQLN